MAINDTYFFTAQGTLAGRNYVHTLHFREGVEAVGSNPSQQLINQWQATCQAAWLGIHTPAYQLVRLTAQRICGTPPLPSRVEEGVGLAGTRSASTAQELLPPWISLAVNESTGLAGKSRHGRFFVSGAGENDIVGETLMTGAGNWLPAITAYCTALTNEFITATPPLEWVLVVHSKKLAEVPGTQCTQSSEPVTALGIVSRLTTQRSRRA